MEKENIGLKKSKRFAIRIVRLYSYLAAKNEFVMSKQILRSGTSIGANMTEGIYAQSRADFVNKMNIALKEAAETDYWLELLRDTEYISREQYSSLHKDCDELIRILVKTVKTTKEEM